MPKALKRGMLRLCTLIFQYDIRKKCFKKSILLSGPNRTSQRSSYLFSLLLTHNTAPQWVKSNLEVASFQTALILQFFNSNLSIYLSDP